MNGAEMSRSFCNLVLINTYIEQTNTIMETISRSKAKEIIYATGGMIFGVRFIKKNGEHRQMNCRLGVKAHLKGGEKAYKPNDYGLVGVFDMQESYRTVNLMTLYELTFAGVTYKVQSEATDGGLVTKKARSPRERYHYGFRY